jgi:hypothetical protein
VLLLLQAFFPKEHLLLVHPLVTVRYLILGAMFLWSCAMLTEQALVVALGFVQTRPEA